MKGHAGPHGPGKCQHPAASTSKCQESGSNGQDHISLINQRLDKLTQAMEMLVSKNTTDSSGGTQPLPAVDKSPIEQQYSLLMAAGEAFDNNPLTDSVTNHVLDPRVGLCVKSTSKKAFHIPQFLSEKAKQRSKTKQDLVLSRSQDSLTFRAEQSHPYAGINTEEWGAANTRLMSALIACGDLKRQDVEFYLAYTATIFDFASQYEWSSIMDFDFNYREQQSQFNFQWGYINPLMELKMLTPKGQQQGTYFKSKQPHRNSYKDQVCRQFLAMGSCRFGDTCRYSHANPQLSGRPSTSFPDYSVPPPTNHQSKNYSVLNSNPHAWGTGH